MWWILLDFSIAGDILTSESEGAFRFLGVVVYEFSVWVSVKKREVGFIGVVIGELTILPLGYTIFTWINGLCCSPCAEGYWTTALQILVPLIIWFFSLNA